jgi:hypothetical protein
VVVYPKSNKESKNQNNKVLYLKILKYSEVEVSLYLTVQNKNKKMQLKLKSKNKIMFKREKYRFLQKYKILDFLIISQKEVCLDQNHKRRNYKINQKLCLKINKLKNRTTCLEELSTKVLYFPINLNKKLVIT